MGHSYGNSRLGKGKKPEFNPTEVSARADKSAERKERKSSETGREFKRIGRTDNAVRKRKVSKKSGFEGIGKTTFRIKNDTGISKPTLFTAGD